MLRSTIHFTQEVHDFGGSVKVRETFTDIERKLLIAKRQEYPTIVCTRQSDKAIIIPVHLIGLIEQYI